VLPELPAGGESGGMVAAWGGDGSGGNAAPAPSPVSTDPAPAVPWVHVHPVWLPEHPESVRSLERAASVEVGAAGPSVPTTVSEDDVAFALILLVTGLTMASRLVRRTP
jgi:hypothetical protein